MSAEVELFTTSILGNPVTRNRHDRYVTARDPRIPGLLVRDEWVGTFEEFEEAVEVSQVREFLNVNAIAEPQFSKWQPSSSDNTLDKSSIPPGPTLIGTSVQPTPSTRELDADQMLSELLPSSSNVSDAEVDALLKELEKPLQRTPRRVYTPKNRSSSSNTEPKSFNDQAASQNARYNPEQRDLVQEAARAIGVDPTPRGPAPRIKLNRRPLQEILAERRSRQAKTENVRKNEELFASLGLNDKAIKDEEVDALLGESKPLLNPTNAAPSSSMQLQEPGSRAESPQQTRSTGKSATNSDSMTSEKDYSVPAAEEQQLSAEVSQIEKMEDGHKFPNSNSKGGKLAETERTAENSPRASLETRDVQSDTPQAKFSQSNDANTKNAQREQYQTPAAPVQDAQSKEIHMKDVQNEENSQSKDDQPDKSTIDGSQPRNSRSENVQFKHEQSQDDSYRDTQTKDTQSENFDIENSQLKDVQPEDANSEDAHSKNAQVASAQHRNSQSSESQFDGNLSKDAQSSEPRSKDLETENAQTGNVQFRNPRTRDSQGTDSQIENSYDDGLKRKVQAEEQTRDLPSENVQSGDPPIEASQTKASQTKSQAVSIQPKNSGSDDSRSTSSQADSPLSTPQAKQPLIRTSLKDRLRKAVHESDSDASLSTSNPSIQSGSATAMDRSYEKALPLSTEKSKIGVVTPEKQLSTDSTAEAQTSESAKSRENDNEIQPMTSMRTEPLDPSQVEDSRLNLTDLTKERDANTTAQNNPLEQSDQASKVPNTCNQSDNSVHASHDSPATQSLHADDDTKTLAIPSTVATTPIATALSKDLPQSESQIAISPPAQKPELEQESVKHDQKAVEASQPDTVGITGQMREADAEARAAQSADETFGPKPADGLTAELQKLSVGDSTSDLSPSNTEQFSRLKLENESSSAVPNTESNQANATELKTDQVTSSATSKQASEAQSKQSESRDPSALSRSLPVTQHHGQQEATAPLKPQDQHRSEDSKSQASPEIDSQEIRSPPEAESGKTDLITPGSPSSNHAPHARPLPSTDHPQVHWESQKDMDEAVLAHPPDPISKPVDGTATIEHLPTPDEHAQDQLRRIRRSDSLKHGIRYLEAGASEESQRVALHQTLDRFSSLEAPIMQDSRSEPAQDSQQERSNTNLLRENANRTTMPVNSSEEQQRIALHQVVDRFSALEPALEVNPTSPSEDTQDVNGSLSSQQLEPPAEDSQRTLDPNTIQQETMATNHSNQDSLSKTTEHRRIAEHQVLDRFSALERPLGLAGNQEMVPESPVSAIDPTSTEQNTDQSPTIRPASTGQDMDHDDDTDLASSHDGDTSDDIPRDHVPDLWISNSKKHSQSPTRRSGLESDWDMQASDLSSSGDKPSPRPTSTRLKDTSQVADKSNQPLSKDTKQISKDTPTKQSTSSTIADESDSDYSQTDLISEEQSDMERRSVDQDQGQSSQSSQQPVSSTRTAQTNQDGFSVTSPSSGNQDASVSVTEPVSDGASSTTVVSVPSQVKPAPESSSDVTPIENSTGSGQQTSNQVVEGLSTTPLVTQPEAHSPDGNNQPETTVKESEFVSGKKLNETKDSEASKVDDGAGISTQGKADGAAVPGLSVLGNHPRAPSTTATNQSEVGRRAVSSLNPERSANESARSASATQRERGHRKTLSAIMKEADAFLQEWTQEK